jgi:hypothetical protein
LNARAHDLAIDRDLGALRDRLLTHRDTAPGAREG